MTKKAKRPLSSFEWAVLITAAVLGCMTLMGYRFFGLGRVMDFLRHIF